MTYVLDPSHPHRAYEVMIQVSGDTWEDVVRRLKWIYENARKNGPAYNGMGGSHADGHFIQVAHDPNQTNENYFQQLDLYLAGGKEGSA